MNQPTTALTIFQQPVPAEIAAAFEGMENIPERLTTPQLSFRGKAFRIVLNGIETILKNAEGDPLQSIRLVLLNLHKQRARSYYEGGWDPDKPRPPACWSNDSVTPDASIAEPQHHECATCPQAAKGARVTESGKAVAACQMFRRVAVIPANDLDFEPLLLRIPQTSLWDKDNAQNEAEGYYAFEQYMGALRDKGIMHTAQVVTRVKFDPRPEYPKLLFGAVGYVPTEQHPRIKELLADARLERLLSVSMGQVDAGRETPAAADTRVAAPAPAAAAAAPAPAAAPTPSVAPPAAAARRPGRPRTPPVVAAPALAPAPASAPAASTEGDDNPVLPGKGNGAAGAPQAAPPAPAAAAVTNDPGLRTLLQNWDA